jgi:hypothetical protein
MNAPDSPHLSLLQPPLELTQDDSDSIPVEVASGISISRLETPLSLGEILLVLRMTPFPTHPLRHQRNE